MALRNAVGLLFVADSRWPGFDDAKWSAAAVVAIASIASQTFPFIILIGAKHAYSFIFWRSRVHDGSGCEVSASATGRPAPPNLLVPPRAAALRDARRDGGAAQAERSFSSHFFEFYVSSAPCFTFVRSSFGTITGSLSRSLLSFGRELGRSLALVLPLSVSANQKSNSCSPASLFYLTLSAIVNRLDIFVSEDTMD